jgi:hypothetical protein
MACGGWVMMFTSIKQKRAVVVLKPSLAFPVVSDTGHIARSILIEYKTKNPGYGLGADDVFRRL